MSNTNQFSALSSIKIDLLKADLTSSVPCISMLPIESYMTLDDWNKYVSAGFSGDNFWERNHTFLLLVLESEGA